MRTEYVYGLVLVESPIQVIVQDGNKKHFLERCRMYNSHIVNGYLLTSYADKEYKAAAKLGGKQMQLRKKRDAKPRGL